MTPQLEAAIAAIGPLSRQERQQLLQILAEDDLLTHAPANLEKLGSISIAF